MYGSVGWECEKSLFTKTFWREWGIGGIKRHRQLENVGWCYKGTREKAVCGCVLGGVKNAMEKGMMGRKIFSILSSEHRSPGVGIKPL